MSTLRSKSAGRWALAAGLAAAGCEVIDPEITVSLAISHHGMRLMDGALPNYGEPDAARVFVNDQGWEVTLSEAVIVNTSAQIESCSGQVYDFELPYGPLPEFQLDQDKDLIDFARVSLPKGTYCTLRVEYGRYLAADVAMAVDTPYVVKGHQDMEGLTVYLAGTAENASGDVVNWGADTPNTIIVELDLKTIEDGKPFQIRGNEPGGKAMVVAKTYDAFFRGVDFAAFNRETFETGLLDVLKAETYVRLGTSVY